MNETVKFEFSVEYPFETAGDLFRMDDITYLQERVRTFRAIHTAEIDGACGKYYDAAIAMIDVFDCIMRSGLGINPRKCTIRINPGQSTTICVDVDHVSNIIYDSAMNPSPNIQKYGITMYYTNAGMNPGYAGLYTLVIMGYDTGTLVSVGDHSVKDVTNSSVIIGDKCFLASPDALRYCECFPTPSALRVMVNKAWEEAKISLKEHMNETVK